MLYDLTNEFLFTLSLPVPFWTAPVFIALYIELHRQLKKVRQESAFQSWGQLKVLAILITLVIASTSFYPNIIFSEANSQYFASLLASFLLAHYLLAYIADRPKVKQLSSHPTGQLMLFTFLILTVALAIYDTEISFYLFCIHFAFSEVYSRSTFNKDYSFFVKTNEYQKVFRVSHVFYLIMLYLYADYPTYRIREIQNFISLDVLLNIVSGLCGLYFATLLCWRKKIFPGLTLSEVSFNYLIPDIFVSLFAVWCHMYLLDGSPLIFYHILFWFLVPIAKYKSKMTKKEVFMRLILPTVSISSLGLLIWWLTSAGPLVYGIASALGIAHIIFSFSFSNLNPTFLRKASSLNQQDPFKA